MPTLNGWLLGYPVVYWVKDHEEAVAASKALSCSVLKRYSLMIAGITRNPGVGNKYSSSRGSSDRSSVAGKKRGSTGVVGAGDLDKEWAVLSFTVPAGLHSVGLDLQLKRLVAAVQTVCAFSSMGGGPDSAHTVDELSVPLTRGTSNSGGASVRWEVEDVGPQAVSL
jgi:hypothetical protein